MQIILALDYLHRNGIVYRDLRPENILVTRDGHMRLTDFACARQLGDRASTSVLGTPEYTAPEIILESGHAFPSDWYSLGILMYAPFNQL